ncbi:recombination regulator RecX [Actinomycetospora corticicola]|uniref:Regulatory protein RecX n=1 Tax=Actinomycetospora corticicola TaxID=663602 RepID=A0A7Y9DVL3_9PSEU|nr:regulatory protein RecX [Actinomycetospora corticicola]NYD36343.1 regulatory protein [Actinomycetospora corticicola]
MAGFGRRPRRPAREAPELEGPADPAADPESVARTICLNLLSVRARTRAELATELTRREVDDEVAATVLDRLEEVRLLDDSAFAEQWVDSRHRHRGLGKRALSQELRHKGVETEVANAALDELDPEAERSKAAELVRKRLPSLDRVEPPVAARRLVGMLARKGYGAGLAYEVVKTEMAARGAEIEAETDLEGDDEVAAGRR